MEDNVRSFLTNMTEIEAVVVLAEMADFKAVLEKIGDPTTADNQTIKCGDTLSLDFREFRPDFEKADQIIAANRLAEAIEAQEAVPTTVAVSDKEYSAKRSSSTQPATPFPGFQSSDKRKTPADHSDKVR